MTDTQVSVPATNAEQEDVPVHEQVPGQAKVREQQPVSMI